MKEKLENALIGEVRDGMAPKEAATLVEDSDVEVTFMASLSHNRVILLFDDEREKRRALDQGSKLWQIFDTVRIWAMNENYDERMTWLECHGLPPFCWCPDNYKAIGEKWGRVIRIDHERDGTTCLTYAHILIVTTTQQRIDACIRMEWEGGKGEVWVREVGCFNGHYVLCRNDETQTMVDISNGQECKDLANMVGENNHENLPSIEVVPETQGEEGETETWNSDCEEESPGNDSKVQEGDKHKNTVDMSIDEMVVGYLSCPAQCVDRDFDPMESIECTLSRSDCEGDANKVMGKTHTGKRMRGRPRRMGNSLPVPLSVESTPSNCSIEAVETWKTVKLLGATSPIEDEILTEIRKSKRIQKLEMTNQGRREQ
ncbi:unnamed protein product [Amaranthus hypochondriacus]